jgi:hypothetical protein
MSILDGLGAFRRFAEAGHAHTVLETEGGRAATEVNGARWVNVVLYQRQARFGRGLPFDQANQEHFWLAGYLFLA